MMKKDTHVNETCSEEIAVYRGAGIMGAEIVVRWHPRYGTVNVTYELRDGTRLGFPETHIPEITKKEFRKSRFRLFLDNLLDKLF